jgi:hypothetical protein
VHNLPDGAPAPELEVGGKKWKDHVFPEKDRDFDLAIVSNDENQTKIIEPETTAHDSAMLSA